ncbi:MAG: hypothetical protein P4M13_05460 [Alphaproteobacteria bacterium]|nr:hypothetical protein [Alphaproteobacteria bacterium]
MGAKHWLRKQAVKMTPLKMGIALAASSLLLAASAVCDASGKGAGSHTGLVITETILSVATGLLSVAYFGAAKKEATERKIKEIWDAKLEAAQRKTEIIEQRFAQKPELVSLSKAVVEWTSARQENAHWGVPDLQGHIDCLRKTVEERACTVRSLVRARMLQRDIT